jgi:hypothetical protein
MVAFALILGMFFVDKELSPLSGLTPMSFALAIVFLGTIGFVVRVAQHLADKKREAQSNAARDVVNQEEEQA